MTNPEAKTVLIVEDQLLLAMTVRDALEDHGYRVLELAIRHQEALDTVAETRPDLALVNIELADGDDGAVLAGELTGMGIPVVFISGQTSRIESSREAAIASMPKPYSTGDMVAAVDYVFRHLAGDESRPGPRGLQMFSPPVAAA
ncbi:MAG: response regulator [Caulobacter sp.]|nr:response regulator [Caulobacter sp.]